MHTPSHTSKGFSLIELSIVLVVFGIVAVGIFSTREVGQEHVQVTSIEETLDHAEQALTFYVKHHGYLPCPASRTDSIDAATYGVSVSCATATASAAPAGTENIGTNTDEYQLRVGMIPTRTLGIPDKYALDAWGNRLTYAMIRSLGIDKATYDAYAPTQTTNYFQVVNKTGTVLYGRDKTEIINYVIISHGPDGKGAYTQSGVQGVACPSNTSDTKNCNSSKQFVMDAVNQTATGTAYFNDFVRWKKTANVIPSAPSPSLMNITQTAWIGAQNTCIVLDDNSIKCAGSNIEGEHGVGNTIPIYNFQAVAGGYQFNFIGHGDNASMAGITTDGRAFAWGRNDGFWAGPTVSALGVNSSSINILSPTQLTGNYTDWTQITVDGSSGCGVRNGEAYCWGWNREGNIGNGTTADSLIPMLVSGGHTDWISLSTGGGSPTHPTQSSVSCGLRGNGKIYCWGEGELGELGTGSWVSTSLPAEVVKEDGTLPGYTDWKYLRFNGAATCGIRAEGLLYCWGKNDRGQVGDGTAINKNIPVRIGAYNDWRGVWPGAHVTCGIRSEGLLYCWGRNERGQAGTGSSTADILTPQQVSPSITDWSYSATRGDYHGCAIRNNGDLYCWGSNQFGAFGNGAVSMVVAPPTLIPGVKVKVVTN